MAVGPIADPAWSFIIALDQSAQVRFHVLIPSPSGDTHALKLVFNFLKRMFFRQTGRLIKTPAM